MDTFGAAKFGHTVKEWFREFHPYAAEHIENEPETVTRIERWIDWQERAYGRAPLFRQDGTRVYDAFALGWALERKHLDDDLELPDELAVLLGAGQVEVHA